MIPRKHIRHMNKIQKIRHYMKEYKTATTLRRVKVWYRLDARRVGNPSRYSWYVIQNRNRSEEK
jgi:hypothetical protein